MPFVVIACLVALARTFITLLNKRVIINKLVFIPILREKPVVLGIKYNVRLRVLVEAH